MRRMLWGLSFFGGQLLGAADRLPAEAPGMPAVEDSRPVILVQQEIHVTSPFVAATSAGHDAIVRLPPVPATRWKPETRWESPVRVARAAAYRPDDGWRSVAPALNSLPIAGGSHHGLTATAAPGPACAQVSPIVAKVPAATSVPATHSGDSSPFGAAESRLHPSYPYAIGGVQPRLPAALPASPYLARNAWGEPTQYVVGQHVRNAFRFLVP